MEIKTPQQLHQHLTKQENVVDVQTVEFLGEPALIFIVSFTFWVRLKMLFSRRYKLVMRLKLDNECRKYMPEEFRFLIVLEV